jgi:hypothetical protein
MADNSNNEPIRPFANFIAEVADGDLNSEAGIELRNLLEALTDAHAKNGGKAKGKLTITIGANYDGKTVGIDYDVAVKKPKKVRSIGICYINKSGNFTLRNPKQTDLPFVRDVSRPAELASEAPVGARIAEGT